MKKILSAVLAAAMAATLFVMPSYAENTFSTAKDFISDVIDLSITGVESQTLDTAKETVMNKITVSGDEVFYDGTSIGFWYSDNSSILYADESKSSTVISPDVEGYVVSPSLLHDMLYDLNDQLEDNYVPSSSDWSKIIGKYDVKLGNITVPANHWVKTSIPTQEDTIGSIGVINITKETGYKGTDLGAIYSSSPTSLRVTPYLIGSDGELYISNIMCSIGAANSVYTVMYETVSDGARTSVIQGGSNYWAVNIPNIKLNLAQVGTPWIKPTIYVTDATHTVYSPAKYQSTLDNSKFCLYKYDNASKAYNGSLDTAKEIGYFWFTNESGVITSQASDHSEHIKMFESCSTSKLVKGNQKLTRRINALSTLLSTDTVTVKADGWTINGHDSIDSYITDQGLNVAGDTANIAALADIDALEFYVVVPTSLPVYVDAKNVTYVADNADITNKSGASVQFTDVTIVPKDDTGWTMVDANPTVVVGGNEFTFDTTIEKDKVLQPEEVYPFEYHAKLSPTTEASSSLELATVLVTVDWAQ